MSTLYILFSILLLTEAAKFSNLQKTIFPVLNVSELNDTLFLTPLLKEGEYKTAQKFSKVTPKIGKVTSYSGLFTINEACGSNMFFWFFPAKKNWKKSPLILWLQGGPGSTSMYGLFEEIGPFKSYKTGLKKRKYPWNVENNLLIIDQPVGVGYSFTTQGCYPQNETAVAEDLYQALVQFHQLFPVFTENKFIISGQSYAGKYIPALGHAIYKHNPTADVKINLTAMMIGDGWVDPVTQIDYASYLYQIGLIDDYEKGIFEYTQDLFLQQIAAGDPNASVTCDALTGSLFDFYVGNVSVYNYLPLPKDEQNWDAFVQSNAVRNALHVGNLSFQTGDDAFNALYHDIILSMKPYVEELLEVYPIIFYNGQLDIICAYPLTVNMLRNLSWSGKNEYLNATRKQWCVGEVLAGYYKSARNLHEVVIRGTGHDVPSGQELWAYNLVNSVCSGSPDKPLHALTTCQ